MTLAIPVPVFTSRAEMEKEYEDTVFALPLYGVSEVFEVDGGYAFVMRLPKDEQYMTENLGTLKSKAYYVTLNDMIDNWLAENPLIMTSFGKSLDPTSLDPIDPEGGEGWIRVLPVVGILLAVVVGIFVVRVFVMRSRLKKGKPIYGKKRNRSKKKSLKK